MSSSVGRLPVVAWFLLVSKVALAEPPRQWPHHEEIDQGKQVEAKPPDPKDASREVPRVAYTHTAFGSSTVSIGAAGMAESHGGASNRAFLGGGIRVWGSPVDRLTLLADGERREANGEFAPSVSAQFRILGSRADGFALAVLGRYKTEGFAELGGETEFGFLGSYAKHALHLDINGVIGGNAEEREGDVELLFRGGYEVTTFLRIGAEGRARQRIAGSRELPGGRSWDAILGPQVLAYSGPAFGAVTGGPSTVGISDRIGWAVIATAGAVAF